VAGAGRPQATRQGDTLTATWAGGGRVVLDLVQSRVLSVSARKETK